MSLSYGIRPHQTVGYEWVPPNLLINGGFEIWQRATSGGAGGAGVLYPSADEWYAYLQTSWTRITPGRYGSYGFRIIGVPQSGIRQSFESWKSLEGLTLTFSADVRTTVPDIRLVFQDYDGTAGGAGGNAHSGSGSWERLTVVYTVRSGLVVNPPPAAGLWPHGFPLLVHVYFSGLSSTGTVDIDGATCVVGNYPEGVPFVPKNPMEDLVRCQRFYETGANFYRSYGIGGSVCSMTQKFKAKKYAAPTLSNTFTPGLGGSAGIVAASTYPTEELTCQMTNGGVAGDFSGTFVWTAEVP